eukprot:comp21464_c0_seq1/m.29692 comp21464_c0_seq1/g.29692  ORF comp21464_c0_seq1/g.29692 comp21464_c0_seq1/m.29692 type:complete len:611 (-) comp21464_c0_seq1:43-1875(-)
MGTQNGVIGMTSRFENIQRTHVADAIRARRMGDKGPFTVLLASLRRANSPAFVLLLQSAKASVSALNRENREVVRAVLKADWSVQGADVAAAYIDFLEHLVSAHAFYLRPVVEMLVKLFWPRSEWEEEDEEEGKEDGGDEVTVSTKIGSDVQNEVYRRAHVALNGVVQVVPASPPTLLDVLKAKFPHKRQKAACHEGYLRNILTVLSYVPALRDSVLTFAIHRIVKIDAEVTEHLDRAEDLEGQTDDEGEGEAEDAVSTGSGVSGEGGGGVEPGHEQELTQDQLVFAMDGVGADGEETGEEGVDDDMGGVFPDELPKVRELGHKLDRLMVVMFDYLDHANNTLPGETVVEKSRRLAGLFAVLLGIFNEVVMSTHKTRFVQFLVFSMTSHGRDLPAVFVRFLLHDKLLNAKTNPVVRINAANYLGSFVARHGLVTVQSAGEAMHEMVAWIHTYISIYDRRCSAGAIDVKQHGLFYAVCQALLYMFCFRHEQLLAHYGRNWVHKLYLSSVIQAKLNPLKVVLDVVVNEFARITMREQLVYCYGIIEENKRIMLPTESEGGGSNRLDLYFPFDPYSLPASEHHIEHYVEWQTSPGDDGIPDSYEHGILPPPPA